MQSNGEFVNPMHGVSEQPAPCQAKASRSNKLCVEPDSVSRRVPSSDMSGWHESSAAASLP
jgi:hypothetical protein